MELIDIFEPDFNDEGQIVDFINGDQLLDRPEERVRQRLQKLLHFQYGYPKNRIAREISIYYGGKELTDIEGKPIRADVGVFRTASAASKKDLGQIEIVCETKRPNRQDGYSQLVSYIFNTSSDGAIWFNEEDIRIWRRLGNKLEEWPSLPKFREVWDAVGRKKKSKLDELKDPKGTLRRCHDRIHRRGITDDVALSMVRILLAKWRDEERPGDDTYFYCTPEELRTLEGRSEVANRVSQLFREVRDANPTVFDPHEEIGASPDEVVEVVTEIQDYKFIGDSDNQWDVMGGAYEQYTAEEMKREGGEFFTNRLIVDLLVKMVVNSPDGIMLDPAGGTGGFCSAFLRRTRRLIRDSVTGHSAQDHAISNLKNKIFLMDKKPRLVKLAKAAMIVSGNGHRGFIQADSLLPFENISQEFLRECPPGKVSFVMTNPPWSGVSGRIDDPLLLKNYAVARRWEWQDGTFQPTKDNELVSGGVPPEYLFVERCIEWLEPNGILAIVLPKGILDNMETALVVRHYLFRNCQVLAVINCHKNTFQPYTGSRGCLIVARKKKMPSDKRNYNIFMAINRKIGQDSEGEPVYKPDDQGRLTHELDQDLDEILKAWNDYLNNKLKESEYTFSIHAKDLDEKTLRLNPQFFLPSLNETLQRIVSLDGNGFTVERLGDRIASNIWKGTRFKREDLEVDTASENTVEYLTPSSIFMQGKGMKLLDLSRCEESRKEEILRHKAREGDILITRSGTLGRVTVVGRTLAGKILSDDLIRLQIDDVHYRALVFAFLKSPGGKDQLLRNEYGTVQQHIEPIHVADILLPLPEDSTKLDAMFSTVTDALEAREKYVETEAKADSEMLNLLRWNE